LKTAGITWRQQAARHRITRLILHPAITLISLLLLFLLVFFGTLYQTDHGLYEAQRMFFGYGIVLLGGIFPVPAASLVLWVLSIQLILTIALILPWKIRKVGLWISHLGVLTLLVGGFITQVLAVESQLTLAEGERGDYSSAYHDWELALWESDADTNHVVAWIDSDLKPGRALSFNPYPVEIEVDNYFRNAAAFNASATGGQPTAINPSGIAMIESRPLEKEVEQNIPGIVFDLKLPGKKDRKFQLYGLETLPLILNVDGKTFKMQLRHRHYPLPFGIKLEEFKRTLHPGTEIAAGYESTVDLIEGEQSRPVRIYMNNPLRHSTYTLFQASFSQERNGLEKSTFAVVTNPGRVLPYVSSLTVFGGLLIHFLILFVAYARRESVK